MSDETEPDGSKVIVIPPGGSAIILDNDWEQTDENKKQVKFHIIHNFQEGTEQHLLMFDHFLLHGAAKAMASDPQRFINEFLADHKQVMKAVTLH